MLITQQIMFANYTKGFARMASSRVLRFFNWFRIFDEEHLTNEIFTEVSSKDFHSSFRILLTAFCVVPFNSLSFLVLEVRPWYIELADRLFRLSCRFELETISL